MSPAPILPVDERQVLLAALAGPIVGPDARTANLCLRLLGRRLLQRAGALSTANGWCGSPDAFVLSRDGWNLLKAERLRTPLRRAG